MHLFHIRTTVKTIFENLRHLLRSLADDFDILKLCQTGKQDPCFFLLQQGQGWDSWDREDKHLQNMQTRHL